MSLLDILGEERLQEIAVQDDHANSKEIYCHCRTLILRPNHARLILPTESMMRVENELKFFQQSDKLSSSIIRGCYWLVDDMYKFEQMGYTKEINAQNLKTPTKPSEESRTTCDTQESDNSGSSNKISEPPPNLKTEALNGMRYLACAECNLCPLGWFDPKTKESYLHVWINK